MSSDVVVLPPSDGDSAEEAQLRSALEQVDRESTGDVEPNKPEVEEPKDDAQKSESQPDEAKKESDSSEAEAETGPKRDPVTGKFLPKDAKVEKGEVQPLEEGKPSPEPEPVAKPDKDQERIARSWQKIEQEKLEVRSALAEVRQLKQQLEQQAQRQSQEQPTFDSKRLMLAADEFERQAASLLQEGDVDQAQAKLKLARETRQYAQQQAQHEATESQKAQASSFEREWNSHAEAAIREHPELGDPKSEAAQAMMELLEDYPILGYIPNGFKVGVEWLSNKKDAAEASGLRTKVTELEKIVKELREKTAISGGGLTGKISPTDFDNMTVEQQETFLLRQARAEDLAHS